MKKILWIAAAVAGLFAAASCQKETPAVSLPEGEEAVAVLAVSVPESIATKAYSDGKTATDLYYAVYDGLDPDRRLLLHNVRNRYCRSRDSRCNSDNNQCIPQREIDTY